MLLLLLAFVLKASAQPAGDSPLTGHFASAADSADFVHASLVVATPTDVVYSVFGHCALRMECPSENLDYIYSLENDGSMLNLFTGRSKGRVVAVPTSEYLECYSNDGRGVTQYELNLSTPEKQRLWQLLDEEMVKPVHLIFNINTNCVTMCMLMLENSLLDERFDFGKLPQQMNLLNGDLVRYCCRRSPWAEFLFMSFVGSASDQVYPLEYRLSPETILLVFQHAVIVDAQDNARSAFKGEPEQLLQIVKPERTSAITPAMAFAALLVLVLIITAGQWLWGWQRVPRACDATLLTLQTLIGCILLFTAIVANLFGTQWNWFLIPFNPLPFILWLCFRHKPWFYRLYAVYATVLVSFLAISPISSQIDLPHQLITTLLLVRCISAFFENRNKIKYIRK